MYIGSVSQPTSRVFSAASMAFGFAAFVFVPSAFADSVRLAATADATLYAEDGDGANGAGSHLFTGTTGQGNGRRALIRFDLSMAGIPAGATVTAASLSLHASRVTSTTSFEVSLHRVTTAWTTGESDAPGQEGDPAAALPGDTTWTQAVYPDTGWTDAGGDYIAAPSATLPVLGADRRYIWSSAELMADLQSWLTAPSTNHGWIIVGEEMESRSAKRFDSADHNDASLHPILSIVYSLPGACCEPDGTCSVANANSCNGEYRGDEVMCSAVTCVAQGACCDAEGACSTSLSGACNGAYQGDGTLCSDDPCPVATGACCDGGSCTDVAHPGGTCAGTYLGGSSSCSPNPCTVATGACCSADGMCTIVDHPGGSCTGTYQGASTTCSPNPCTQPTGACCDGTGTCNDTTAAACSGVWHGDSVSCAMNPCSEPTAACCDAQGECSVSTPSTCSGSVEAGQPLCGFETCEPPDGACCAPDGSCSLATPLTCAGTFEGAATTCDAVTCAQPTGACCTDTNACTETTAADCTTDYLGDGTACEAGMCPLILTPFVDELPRPAVAQPTSGEAGGAADYQLWFRQIRQQLHRDLPETTLWAYDDGTGGTYPGPTIEARSNELVRVTWTNDLRDSDGEPLTEHFLPVDTCPHGAGRGDTRVVTHLHGGHIASEFDGQPEETLMPGQSVTYDFPNWQTAGTLWYHDHALGTTRINVYAGLAAFYIVRDDVEDALNLPSGEYEVPLVVQDKKFNADGSLSYPAEWQEHFFGDVNLVNGKVWPYLNVDRGLYRFRVLNGANSRTYTLRFSDNRAMTVIGVDGGLLEAPESLTEITLGPAERADILVDFSDLAPGSVVELNNSALSPFPNGNTGPLVRDVMQFRVTGAFGAPNTIPDTLRTINPLDETEVATTRDFILRRNGGTECGGRAWLINGLHWDAITERPALGTTEVWRFINRSGISHPMHVHLDFFQILDRQAFQVVNDEVVPMGDPQEPEIWERGWKDTVMVAPNEIVRVVTRFEDFVGRFPYHCHILEHEDHEMMRQYETTTSCGDGARGLPIEECDDGNQIDGDGCSASCRLEAMPDAGVGDGGANDAGADAGAEDAAAGDSGSDSGSTADASNPDARIDAGMDGGISGGGCGCRSAGRDSRGAMLLPFLALLWATRRR